MTCIKSAAAGITFGAPQGGVQDAKVENVAQITGEPRGRGVCVGGWAHGGGKQKEGNNVVRREITINQGFSVG